MFLLAYFFIEKDTNNMRKEQIITTNNNQIEEKGMKSRFVHFKKRMVLAVSGAFIQISKDTDLYRLYNTNFHEIAEQKEKEAMS